jgi:DNA repair exonuclease SbcCD ATPase subunit
VDRLFQDEQRALADKFSRPLARKISGYLQSLFGTDVEAAVTFQDTRLQAIQLVRSAQDAAEPFEALSGGTREQVAAAVRLAIAELLSTDHENALPVVFDDSFAYSDPERVQALQRMLDLGASRGLQLIVLSCNPADYAALGARQVTLKPVPGTAANSKGGES